MRASIPSAVFTALAAMSVVVLPGTAAASVFGSLGNFDVVNDTGHTAHGFEIELEDLHLGDVSDVFGGPGRGFPTGRGFDPASSVERYGAPLITEYNNGQTFGVHVTYAGIFDGLSWDFGTPSGAFVTPGDNCWSGGGVGYGASTPCDHFGVGTTKAPTKTNYSWLLETDPASAVLTKAGFNLPAPVWQVIPNQVNVEAPPQVIAQIQAPEAEVAGQFGEALWVKVYTTELENEPELEDLIAGKPAVDVAETEIEWQLLQSNPKNPLKGLLELGRQAGGNAKSVVRRYEFFEYIGPYDAVDHEALVIDDSNPLASELGNYRGAQNAAVNLAAVPVPTAVVLFGSSLFGLAAMRRRRAPRDA